MKTGPMKISVGGLTDQLADISNQDLKQLFDPFGEIDLVEIQKDPISGKTKGYAFIQFKNSADARAAIQKMDNFMINERPIKVNPVGYNQAGDNIEGPPMLNQNLEINILDLEDESGLNYVKAYFFLRSDVLAHGISQGAAYAITDKKRRIANCKAALVWFQPSNANCCEPKSLASDSQHELVGPASGVVRSLEIRDSGKHVQ